MKKVFSIIIIGIVTLTLIGCKEKSYKVTFDTKREDAIESVRVYPGNNLELPIPNVETSNFIGWYNLEDDTFFSSNDPVNKDIDLYARYEPIYSVGYETYLSEDNPVVTIEIVDYGMMQIELFPSVAPNTVKNFIALIEDGYYEGLTFHRIIATFMIQGGRGDALTCNIKGEFLYNDFDNPLLHHRGIISMARTQVYDSATSQFFIVHQDSLFLDKQYAAFGGLISGFTVLDNIARVKTNTVDAPLEEIVIATVTVDTKGINYDSPDCG